MTDLTQSKNKALSLLESKTSIELSNQEFNDRLFVQIPTYAINPNKYIFNKDLASIAFSFGFYNARQELRAFVASICYEEYAESSYFVTDLYVVAAKQYEHERAYFSLRTSWTTAQKQYNEQFENVVAYLKQVPCECNVPTPSQRVADSQTLAVNVPNNCQPVYEARIRESRRVAEPFLEVPYRDTEHVYHALPAFDASTNKRITPHSPTQITEYYTFYPYINKSQQYASVNAKWSLPKQDIPAKYPERYAFRPKINKNSIYLASYKRQRDAERKYKEKETYYEAIAHPKSVYPQISHRSPSQITNDTERYKRDVLIKYKAEMLLKQLEYEYDL